MSLWNKLWESVFGRKSDAEPSPAAAEPSAPSAVDESVSATFGVTASDPILCDQPSGERAYIGSLRCPQGHRLRGSRRGSMQGKCSDPAHHVAMMILSGANPAESCIVDCYDLVCEGGEYSCALYFDMYHPKAPPQPAPRGMTRV
jgi:hypothetical protein